MVLRRHTGSYLHNTHRSGRRWELKLGRLNSINLTNDRGKRPKFSGQPVKTNGQDEAQSQHNRLRSLNEPSIIQIYLLMPVTSELGCYQTRRNKMPRHAH